MKTFIQFFVEKSQFTYLLFIGIVLTGAYSLLSMPRGEDPEIDGPYYTVTVIMPGASPEEMKDQVIKPLEDRLYEMENIYQIKSTSGNNFGVIGVEYDYNVDKNEKYQEVIREVESLKASVLPANIRSIDIKKFGSSDVNAYQITLQSATATYAEMEEQSTILKNKLKKVDGIKTVETWGFPLQEVHVELNMDKLAEYRLPVEGVMAALQRNSHHIPAGNIATGQTSFNVKAGDTYNSVEEIEQTIIRSRNSQYIRLRDVAEVKHAYETEKHIIRLNEIPSVLVTASLKPGGNIVSVAEETEPVIREFAESLPPHIQLVKNVDQSIGVKERLNHLGRDFLIAILLVSITLLPLGFRSTIVVMISVPLSLAIGLIFLNYFGYTLNQLSIVGLILALGILVDDSIVVNENIERTLRSGIPLKKAIIESTAQIAWAIIGVTTTLIIAFIPIMLLPESSGDFIRSLPMAVVLTVAASLFVSLTFVPFFSSRILKDKVHPEGNIFLRGLNKGIHLTYGRIMEKSLRHPWRAVGIVGIVVVACLMVLPFMGFSLFPKTDKLQFQIEMRTSTNATLDYTDRKTREVEAVLKRHAGIEYYTTNVGKSNPQVYYNVNNNIEEINYANIFVQCEENMSQEEKTGLIQTLRSDLKQIKDVEIRVLEFEQGPPLEAPVAIRVFGSNQDSLQIYAYQVEEIMKSVEGIMYVENLQALNKTELKVQVNKEKAAIYGIEEADIDRAVHMAIAGIPTGEIQFDNSESKSRILLSLPKEKVQDMEVFEKIRVPSFQGTALPLKNVAEIVFEKTPGNITHIDRGPYTTIRGFAEDGYSYNELNEAVITKLNEEFSPASGYTWEAAGEKENQNRTFAGFGIIVLLATFAFFAALILEFRSLKSTFIVISVIPLGFAGSVMTLFLTGNGLSFVALVGFIALIGIEIKNSILLVDYTNQLREEGMPLDEAVAKAGEVRFIPILLTALTAIAGMVPLIVSYSPLYTPLALVIVGGLISSLLFSRVLTPVLYKLLPPKVENNT